MPNPFYNFLVGLVGSVRPGPSDIAADGQIRPYSDPRITLMLELLFPSSMFVSVPHYFTQRQRELLDWLRHMMAYQIADTVFRPTEFFSDKKRSRVAYYVQYYGSQSLELETCLKQLTELFERFDLPESVSADSAVLALHILCQFFACASRVVGLEKYAYLLDQYHREMIDFAKDFEWERVRTSKSVEQFVTKASGMEGHLQDDSTDTDELSPRWQASPSVLSDRANCVVSQGSEIECTLPCSPYAVPPVSQPLCTPKHFWVAPDMPLLSSPGMRHKREVLLNIHETIRRIYSPKSRPVFHQLKQSPVPWVWWLLDDEGSFPPRRIRYILYLRLLSELQNSVPDSFSTLETPALAADELERQIWAFEVDEYREHYLKYLRTTLKSSIWKTVLSGADPVSLQGFKTDMFAVLLTMCGLSVIVAAIFSILSLFLL